MEMKVTKWFKDYLTSKSSQLLESLLMMILFILPLGVSLIVLQFRSKASSVSNLSVHTTDRSVWQFVYPGFMLVAIDPMLFKTIIKTKNDNFQRWVERNKYTLSFLLALIIVCLMLVKL